MGPKLYSGHSNWTIFDVYVDICETLILNLVEISIELYWEADGGEIINIETLDKNWFVQCREIKIANLKRGCVRVQHRAEAKEKLS